MKVNTDNVAHKFIWQQDLLTHGKYVLEQCCGYLIYDNVLQDHITMVGSTIYTKLKSNVYQNKAIQHGKWLQALVVGRSTYSPTGWTQEIGTYFCMP